MEVIVEPNEGEKKCIQNFGKKTSMVENIFLHLPEGIMTKR